MQTNLYFKRFHYHIILSIFNAMMESFVAFAKKYIYILYVKPRNTFMFFFFEIVKNLVASEKYLEHCETLIINLYIVWKSQMYCPSGLTMQDLFFVTEIDNTLTVRNPSSRQSKPAIVSQNAYYNTPD